MCRGFTLLIDVNFQLRICLVNSRFAVLCITQYCLQALPGFRKSIFFWVTNYVNSKNKNKNKTKNFTMFARSRRLLPGGQNPKPWGDGGGGGGQQEDLSAFTPVVHEVITPLLTCCPLHNPRVHPIILTWLNGQTFVPRKVVSTQHIFSLQMTVF